MIQIPANTIEELKTLRADARLAAENFTEAVAAQAEQYDIPKGALRRYICAAEKGDLQKLDAEADALATLLERAEAA